MNDWADWPTAGRQAVWSRGWRYIWWSVAVWTTVHKPRLATATPGDVIKISDPTEGRRCTLLAVQIYEKECFGGRLSSCPMGGRSPGAGWSLENPCTSDRMRERCGWSKPRPRPSPGRRLLSDDLKWLQMRLDGEFPFCFESGIAFIK